MKILLFFIIIFYNISAFSYSKKEAIYQEEEPLFEELAISSGYHLAWIECSSAGDGQKVSQEIKKLVAKLSWPDFKIFNNSAAVASNNPPKFVGFFCNSGVNKFKEVESLLYNYVEELKFKIENINSTITETKNEQEYTSEDIIKINNSEDLNLINIKELTKIKNIEIEKILNGSATLGYFLGGEIFESIYYSTNPGEKGGYKFVNKTGQYGGTYKISTSKICYLMENENDWSCAVAYKKNKNNKEIYLANKGKIYAKIVSVMKIPEYEKMKLENSASEKKRIAKKKKLEEEERIAEEKSKEEKAITEEKEKKEKAIVEEKEKAEILKNKELLQEAQHYINDLQEFVKVNPAVFDVLKITKFLIANKDILNGVWGEDQQNNFNIFKEYTNKSNAFLEFHEQQKDKRNAIIQVRISTEKDRLNSSISDLTSYLQNNLTSVQAPKIVEQIELAETALEKKKLQELIDANQKITDFIKKLDQIDTQVITLKNYLKVLTNYLNKDLTSVLAPDIVEQIESSQRAIETKKLKELSENINSSASLSEKLYEIETVLIKLRDYISILTTYLQNDLTSDLAPKIVELIESSQRAIENKSLPELYQTQKYVSDFIMKEEKRIAMETINLNLKKGIFKKNPNNLPICSPDIVDIKMGHQGDQTTKFDKWKNCWGTLFYTQNNQWQLCAGMCKITMITEGEFKNVNSGFEGFRMQYSEDSIIIGNFTSDGEGSGIVIRDRGFQNISGCKWKNRNSTESFVDCSRNSEFQRNLSSYTCDTSYPWVCELVEFKDASTLIDVNKEYIAISNANIRKEPSINSEIITTIEKGTTLLVQKKTQSGDWFLIKEIKKNWGDEDIGEILGYSSSDLYQTLDTFNKSISKNQENNSSNYSNPPGQLLTDAYLYYILIKKMYEARQGYAVVYINDVQMTKAKKQVEEIEKILLSEFELDEELIWTRANMKYKKDYSSVDLITATGAYNDDGSRVAKMLTLSLDGIAEEVIEQKQDKDF